MWVDLSGQWERDRGWGEVNGRSAADELNVAMVNGHVGVGAGRGEGDLI